MAVPSGASGAVGPPGLRRSALYLVLAAVAVLYLPTLFADFVNIDDGPYVTQNPLVRAPRLFVILNPRTDTAFDWTPVVTLSHAAEYWMFGLRPMAYHATNLMLHLVCMLLAYRLLRDLGAGEWESIAAVLIFGIHPLQVESVAWISSRKNLLAALFGLLFVRAFGAGRPGLALPCLLMALGSKGTASAFVLWAAILVLAGHVALPTKRAWTWVALYGGLAVSRGLLSMGLQAAVIAGRDVGQMPLLTRLAVMGPVFATQVRQMFAPFDLCLRYLWLPMRWSDPGVLQSWAVLAGVCGLVVWLAWRHRTTAVAACLTVAALLPTANVFPAPDFQADRYVYAALIGGAYVAVRLLRVLKRVGAWVPVAVFAAWCAVLIPVARARIDVWRDSEALWQDTVARWPQFWFGWNLLATHYLDRGQGDKAEAALRMVIAIDPGEPTARHNLALLLLNQGSLDEALAHATTHVQAYPDLVGAQALLGRILLAAGRPAESLVHLDAALRLRPDLARARNDRASAYVALGDLASAAKELEPAARGPTVDPQALVLLGLVRLRQGDVADAAALTQQATEVAPRLAEAWDARAQVLLAAGDVQQAEAIITRALEMQPTSPDLQYRLAEVRWRMGEPEAARQAATAALEYLGGAPREWKAAAEGLAR